MREQDELQASDIKRRQVQHMAMSKTAVRSYQDKVQQAQQQISNHYVPYYMDVPCFQQ